MDFSDFMSNAIDQDRGRTLEITNPFTGERTGMRFTIAGPDSDTHRRARLEMADELAEIARPDGTVTAEMREMARINCLARLVLGWDLREGGKPIPFEHRHVVRVLRASSAIQQQVDAFAGDRRNFAPEAL